MGDTTPSDLRSFLLKHIRKPSTPLPEGRDQGAPLTNAEVDGWIAAMPPGAEAAIDRVAADLFPLADALIADLDTHGWLRPDQVKRSPAFAEVKRMPADRRGDAMAASMLLGTRLCWSRGPGEERFGPNVWKANLLQNLSRLLASEREVRATIEHFRVLVDACLDVDSAPEFIAFDLVNSLRVHGPFASGAAIATQDKVRLRRLRDAIERFEESADVRAVLRQLEALIGDTDRWPLPEGDAWSDAVSATLDARPAAERSAWLSVLGHLGACGAARASAAWSKEARRLADGLGGPAVAAMADAWLAAAVAHDWPPPGDPFARYGTPEFDEIVRQSRQTAVVVGHQVGAVWLAATFFGPTTPGHLAAIAEFVARQKAAVRTRVAGLGSAAIRALGSLETDDALAQLSRLTLRLRWPKLKKQAVKEYERLVKARGLDPTVVEESIVPDFGLVDGVATIDLAHGNAARLTLGRSGKPAIEWLAADGKTSRVVPKVLKPHAAAVKRTAEEIERMLAAQRTRLDLLLRRRRSWPIDVWRSRYLDQGLVGLLARRLIWLIDDVAAFWHDGELVGIDGKRRKIAAKATVQMWHPALRPTDEVLAWRDALERWEVTQPFKQAHREIYLLTDAERRTNTYSNRFAGHIVRGPTLLAISQARHWKMGQFGGASSPSVELPDENLRVEWWMEAAGDDHTPYGAPLYLATDQARFVDRATNEPVPLERVPVLSLSEAMRDIDLFVGLASVGSDPDWQDGGPQVERFRTYWRDYSFGDLSASAKTRREALAVLLPRLTKLKGKWSLDDKFLRVVGTIRAYKIHLGSGNILMEPNDQYLCIVPDRSAKSESRDGLFLPFEGDAVLSIILSKAFLLAADDQIKDASITRQIGR